MQLQLSEGLARSRTIKRLPRYEDENGNRIAKETLLCGAVAVIIGGLIGCREARATTMEVVVSGNASRPRS